MKRAKPHQITLYIPTLNSELTIRECLDNVKKQTYPIASVIVVDGGSSDHTAELVKKYNIPILRQERKGLSNARNTALQLCRTEFIASIDSDVVLDKDWLSQIMKNFNDDFVAGACGRLEEKHVCSLADRWRDFHLRQNWGDSIIRNPDFLFGSDSVFRTVQLSKIKGYDERYLTNFEDVDISRLLKKQGHTIIYDAGALCWHIKKDTLGSVIRTARNWSFHSYPHPDDLFHLIKRLLIYNPHLALRFVLREIRAFKLTYIPVTILAFFYNEFFDARYYFAESRR